MQYFKQITPKDGTGSTSAWGASMWGRIIRTKWSEPGEPNLSTRSWRALDHEKERPFKCSGEETEELKPCAT